ncbi:hypothetical protein BU24DRAFT_231674 [Aaosphaeria arxii CBS 175.79]|uniref:Uncharacterized protein n=1 Tax=Aaosphaeria arxii CBS 175.79 TaxID=1450172 RepID=A0A6A5XJX0_9PLEO|nr:uncharacterized protein BU24DRAFT_231674 [Aaosphaeria arxii CBS 175.79]KAF2013176.1 hypothetical protein BU24DRAFT_231674 [Aaosphaeria arxii CBS 175.79]
MGEQVVVRSEDVEKERKKAHARARELRAAFQDASEQSLKSSRRLDDTYYSILEKVGVLRQTIGSLQELSSMTKELHANLETDTKELVDDVQGQFEAFGDFETQKSQVNDLEERIKAGKEKADALTKRLESARQRVEARAKIEAEGEAKISRRLRIVWGVAVLVLCMIVVAILFQQLKPTRRPHAHPSLHFEARQNLIDIMEGMPESAKQALAVPLSSRPTRSSKFAPTPSVLVDDDRLRIFDEL